MIATYSPLMMAFLGNLVGWASTAAGAALIFPLEYLNLPRKQMQLVLDASLGASVGVMIAASFFSLLAPAIAEAEVLWPENPHANWMVAAVGFLGGGLLMILADEYLPEDLVESFAPTSSTASTAPTPAPTPTKKTSGRRSRNSSRGRASSSARQRKTATTATTKSASTKKKGKAEQPRTLEQKKSWKRIVLLVLAISLHNAPEGGAVGVAFGGLQQSSTADVAAVNAAAATCVEHSCQPKKSTGMTFATARSVAIGIGLQNFPEGLAVSLPLRREGCSLMTSFWWGQLSGLVEVFAGLLGAYTVQSARFCLPISLAGAAGAMIYVCCAELLVEAHQHGNSKWVNGGVMIGFTVMMILDVALG